MLLNKINQHEHLVDDTVSRGAYANDRWDNSVDETFTKRKQLAPGTNSWSDVDSFHYLPDCINYYWQVTSGKSPDVTCCKTSITFLPDFLGAFFPFPLAHTHMIWCLFHNWACNSSPHSSLISWSYVWQLRAGLFQVLFHSRDNMFSSSLFSVDSIEGA